MNSQIINNPNSSNDLLFKFSYNLLEMYWLFKYRCCINSYNIVIDNDIITTIFQYYVRLRVNWWSFEDYCMMYKRRMFMIAVNYRHPVIVEPYIYEYDEVMVEILDFSEDMIDEREYQLHELIIIDIQTELHSKYVVVTEFEKKIKYNCEKWQDAVDFTKYYGRRYENRCIVIDLEVLTPRFLGQPKRKPFSPERIEANCMSSMDLLKLSSEESEEEDSDIY